MNVNFLLKVKIERVKMINFTGVFQLPFTGNGIGLPFCYNDGNAKERNFDVDAQFISEFS